MKILGRTDKADFPELDLKNIAIKIDTGAYSSSIHCHHIAEKEEDGIPVVEFEILDPSFNEHTGRKIKTKNFKTKQVKSSNGVSEERYFVNTEIVLFEKKHTIQLSLTDRGKMKYPVLIGRRFLKHKFLVDTAVKNASFDQHPKQ